MKGARAGEHLVEHGAEREDVGAVIDRLAAAPARATCSRRCRGSPPAARLVASGPRDSASRRVFAQLGDAEVEELDPPVAGDEHVGRLDVAVPDALLRAPRRAPARSGCRSSTALRNGSAPRSRRARSVSPSSSSVTRYGMPPSVPTSNTGDDVGMVQAAGGARFAAEPRDGFGVDGERRRILTATSRRAENRARDRPRPCPPAPSSPTIVRDRGGRRGRGTGGAFGGPDGDSATVWRLRYRFGATTADDGYALRRFEPAAAGVSGAGPVQVKTWGNCPHR